MKNIKLNPIFKELTQLIDKLSVEERSAQKAYAHAHARMVDLQHEIEFSEGYEAPLKVQVFDELKSVAKERRAYKDTLLVFNMLHKLLCEGTDLASIAKLLEDSGEDWSRHYSPRENKDLDFTSPETLKDSRINRKKNLTDSV